MATKKKYPKTPHFSFSEALQNDDRKIENLDGFNGKEVIVSIKMDGENTSLTNEYIHARSLDSVDHPSRHWVKGLWGQIKHNIPDNMIICGENMFAHHSIFYDDLSTYFYVFNIWYNDVCLSYDETLEYCQLLGLQHVPVLYRGVFDEKLIKKIYDDLDKEKVEGIVVRTTDSFHRDDFQRYCAKAVRKGHVQTDGHWMTRPVTPNQLKNEDI